jgi:hypothetical protein
MSSLCCVKVAILTVFSLAVSLAFGRTTSAQGQTAVPTTVSAGLVLDAAGVEQRKSLNAIYLIVCPGVGAGSGFLLDRGIVVTNVHVVATCTEQTLVGITTSSQQVKFSKIIQDAGRDLALLVPEHELTGGLKLATKDNPEPGTVVSTWGYPFVYNGATPLLSVGYVAGYRSDTSSRAAVKHIIVNGAFNHGNSGGPLLVSHDNQVIGVVVLTFNFYPPEVKEIIDGFSKMNSGMMLQTNNPDGSHGLVSEAQLTAMVLSEFYQKTQVMIGEAIAASELAAVIRQHSSDLPAKSPQGSQRSK